MQIVYIDRYKFSPGNRLRVKHTIVLKRNTINRNITPHAGDDIYVNMCGAKYNKRPFDYFKDMLSEYVKRKQ